jgi:YVTN family beta-propeller protein
MRTLRSLSAVIAVSTLAAAAAACGGASPPPVAPVARAPEVRGCGRALDASRSPVPLGLTRAGSTVALAKLGDKTLAYIADEDDSAVHVIDVDTQKDISKTPVAGKPGQLMFLADGRLVVTIRDHAQA